MSRVLALIAAVAMIAGALVVRERLDAGADAGEQASEPDEVAPVAGDLTCASELRAACARLDTEELGVTVDVEPAGVTADAIVADPAAAPDLWLVPAPWPELVQIDSDQVGAAVPADVSDVLARSPLVFVGFSERLDALEAACAGTVTWRCIGDNAGTPWTELGLTGTGSAVVRPGHLDPTQNGIGLLVLGSAVASWAGGTDLNRNDLDSEDFSAWFDRLESAIPEFSPASGSQVTDMLTRGLASYDVVGTAEAEAAALLGPERTGPLALELRPFEPAASADVVLVAFGGEGSVDEAVERLGEPLRAALSESGWQAEGGPVADGVGLPDDAGLPSAGFLLALQDRWREVAG